MSICFPNHNDTGKKLPKIQMFLCCGFAFEMGKNTGKLREKKDYADATSSELTGTAYPIRHQPNYWWYPTAGMERKKLITAQKGDNAQISNLKYISINIIKYGKMKPVTKINRLQKCLLLRKAGGFHEEKNHDIRGVATFPAPSHNPPPSFVSSPTPRPGRRLGLPSLLLAARLLLRQGSHN